MFRGGGGCKKMESLRAGSVKGGLEKKRLKRGSTKILPHGVGQNCVLKIYQNKHIYRYFRGGVQKI